MAGVPKRFFCAASLREDCGAISGAGLLSAFPISENEECAMILHRIGRCALFGAVGVMAAALAGCGGTSLSKPFGTNPNDTNKERVLNTLVGGPSTAVDIAQRSINLNSVPLAFGQGNNYAIVSSGISVKTDAYRSGTTTTVAPESGVTMTRDFFYTEVLAGIYGTSGTTAPQLIQFSDNFPASVPASSVALRFVNLVPDSPALSLYNTSGTPATAVAITGLGNVAYGTMSSSGSSNYITATAGAYILSIRDNAGKALTANFAVTLGGGHVYSVFIYGLISPSGGQPATQIALLTDQ
jgi:hypothetical protein